VSRVRENRMHGSRWRREETGTSRQRRAELGASRRPYTREGFKPLLERTGALAGNRAAHGKRTRAPVRARQGGQRDAEHRRRPG